jgi:hypothetical protein
MNVSLMSTAYQVEFAGDLGTPRGTPRAHTNTTASEAMGGGGLETGAAEVRLAAGDGRMKVGKGVGGGRAPQPRVRATLSTQTYHHSSVPSTARSLVLLLGMWVRPSSRGRLGRLAARRNPVRQQRRAGNQVSVRRRNRFVPSRSVGACWR